MADRKEQLTAVSDRLLDGLFELRRIEAKKRQQPISSPEFHALAEEVTKKSRELMSTASVQEAIGNETERSAESIEDIGDRQENTR